MGNTSNRRNQSGIRWLVLLGLVAIAAVCAVLDTNARKANPEPGWGVDACVTAHVAEDERDSYLRLLRKSGVVWLREREPNSGMKDLKKDGFRVVSFLGDLHAGHARPGSVLPDDLLAVYSGAKALARSHDAHYVDAWEMVGEPDVGYCTDLPDQLVAYQKAVYLGLKAGAAESQDGNLQTAIGQSTADSRHRETTVQRVPLVLMGALALPPGPWLDRAVRNGLLDYTDAYNFHFYGLANDLPGVIAAHRVVALAIPMTGKRLPEEGNQAPEGFGWAPRIDSRKIGAQIQSFDCGNARVSPVLSSAVPSLTRALPLWITECGIAAVTMSDFLNPGRRQLQAAFTIETASEARAAKDVAMFMPFILVHRDDPYAMTLSPSRTLPAWDAYVKITKENKWPERPLSEPPHKPNLVVVQWMPDADAALPHKVSGTYRFRQRKEMRGEIRVYNFSGETRRGSLQSVVPAMFLSTQKPALPIVSDLTIPAGSRVVFPVTFTAPATGYVRGECEFEFADISGEKSKMSFGLETWPRSMDFAERPFELRPLPGRQLKFPEFSAYEPGESCGPWQTINHLHAAVANGTNGFLFWTDKPLPDPMMPTMAFAAVNGVPSDGFLRVQLDQPMVPGRSVRVDLVDADGQRFCIWENLGQSYFVNSSEVWLNVHDMQIYFWGRCTVNPRFHPERVREIQLRFYCNKAGERMRVRLSWMEPRPER